MVFNHCGDAEKSVRVDFVFVANSILVVGWGGRIYVRRTIVKEDWNTLIIRNSGKVDFYVRRNCRNMCTGAVPIAGIPFIKDYVARTKFQLKRRHL